MTDPPMAGPRDVCTSCGSLELVRLTHWRTCRQCRSGWIVWDPPPRRERESKHHQYQQPEDAQHEHAQRPLNGFGPVILAVEHQRMRSTPSKQN
jgi:hypothetical protein